MHIRLRVHHWVLWWFIAGVIGGTVALINILGHDLTRMQERVLLLTGVAHWILGGLICYASSGIRVEEAHHDESRPRPSHHADVEEWHAASDFLLPGNRKSLLPRKYL
jgi:hypothetical protein